MTNNMVVQPKMSKQDKEWQAESDAQTLAKSREIMDDPKRLAAAAKKAQYLAQERAKEAKAMAKVAAKAPSKPTVSSKPVKKAKGKK